jgi:predicted RNase H-like HicB family nuclease
MTLTIELECEEDGRWIAEVLEIPGALAYGTSQEDASQRVKVLALQVLADRAAHGEALLPDSLAFVAAAA